MEENRTIPRNSNPLDDFNPVTYNLAKGVKFLDSTFGKGWVYKVNLDNLKLRGTHWHLLGQLGDKPPYYYWGPPAAIMTLKEFRHCGFRAIQRSSPKKTKEEARKLKLTWKLLITKLQGDSERAQAYIKEKNLRKSRPSDTEG
jgi:hypothetical protein